MKKLVTRICNGCGRDCRAGVRDRVPVCDECRASDDEPAGAVGLVIIRDGEPSVVDPLGGDEEPDPYHGETFR